MKERTYVCCDLKSFYASVECVERGLDPMTTNLVVADKRRTEKTICLAVTPSLKAYGISGRARLFEVVQRVAEVNAQRRWNAPGHQFSGSSWNDPEVRRDPSLELDYIVAPPRMAHYIDWSTRIYQVYLKYIAPEDIYPYSIDEVFMDITDYLDTYKMTARELTRTIILDILKTTGITAAAGMGTNLYLAKVSMDIVAKHVHADKDGVRIAKLNEMTYRRLLWSHRPLTDFWRVGKGYAAKLEGCGLYTMGDIARCAIGKPTDYHRGVFGHECPLNEHLDTLNALTRYLQAFDEQALEKFHTVFDTAWPQTPEEVLSLAENLHEFTVVPDISTAEEYGRYIIRESGHFEVDPNLEDYIDYQSYGERRVREDGGLFGDRGYVAYLGTKPEMNEIMARNIPAERMEQGPQMGGLT